MKFRQELSAAGRLTYGPHVLRHGETRKGETLEDYNRCSPTIPGYGSFNLSPETL